jgi:glucose/arabinose dehydrogenase
VLLDRIDAAPARPAAVVRFGPDAKLYLALDDGGDPSRGGDLGSFSGKVLRLNGDGTTPSDQPAASPVFSLGLGSPRGMAWDALGSPLWLIDAAAGAPEQLRADAPADGRGEVVSRYLLTAGGGASSVVVYRGALIPAFQGDVLIAAEADRSLLRLRFDPAAPRRVLTTERLLRNAVGPISAVGVDPQGAIYLAAAPFLIRLQPALAVAR